MKNVNEYAGAYKNGYDDEYKQENPQGHEYEYKHANASKHEYLYSLKSADPLGHETFWSHVFPIP